MTKRPDEAIEDCRYQKSLGLFVPTNQVAPQLPADAELEPDDPAAEYERLTSEEGKAMQAKERAIAQARTDAFYRPIKAELRKLGLSHEDLTEVLHGLEQDGYSVDGISLNEAVSIATEARRKVLDARTLARMESLDRQDRATEDTTHTRSNQGVNASGGAGRSEPLPTIEDTEAETPRLNLESVEWIAATKENRKKLGYSTATLANYRQAVNGGRQLDAYFGIDKDGRRWRRCTDRTETSRVFYFAPDLKKYHRKVS